MSSVRSERIRSQCWLTRVHNYLCLYVGAIALQWIEENVLGNSEQNRKHSFDSSPNSAHISFPERRNSTELPVDSGMWRLWHFCAFVPFHAHKCYSMLFSMHVCYAELWHTALLCHAMLCPQPITSIQNHCECLAMCVIHRSKLYLTILCLLFIIIEKRSQISGHQHILPVLLLCCSSVGSLILMLAVACDHTLGSQLVSN